MSFFLDIVGILFGNSMKSSPNATYSFKAKSWAGEALPLASGAFGKSGRKARGLESPTPGIDSGHGMR